ncbi:MAG TPA: hypothetical protein VEF06_05540 [Bryobacteraceae bacterium]|nr:hypothetical protein [Bryobacteraceae bacterium]
MQPPQPPPAPSAPEPEPGSESAGPQAEEDPMLYCPVCSTHLVSRQCKLICPKCGYYMSCADYY